MAAPLPFIYLGSALAFATVAAIHDVRERRIPNRVSGLGALVGLLLHLFLAGIAQCAWALLAGLLAGAIFFLFYLAGGMGAGDVKLITAVGCICGLHYIVGLLAFTAIAGGIMAAGLAIACGRLKQTFFNVAELISHHGSAGLTPHPEINVLNASTLRLPYALAITAGSAITLYLQGVQR